MKKLHILFILVFSFTVVKAQLVPDAKVKFTIVETSKIFTDPKTKKTSKKIIDTENAISVVEISTTNDGLTTYFDFDSSLTGSSSSTIMTSKLILSENGVKVYLVKSKSIVHDTESTWNFVYNQEKLVRVDFLLLEKNMSLSFK